jgi:hypothetical protein
MLARRANDDDPDQARDLAQQAAMVATQSGYGGIERRAQTLLAEGLGIEPGITHIVLAEDFMTEVASTDREIALQHGGSTGPPFTVERLGGLVAGKTLAHHDNHLDATVLIASGMIAWDDQAGFATGISLLAHELAHLCIGRARWASGALEGVLFPSTTGTEYARSIARTSSEEYRATVLANIVFGVVVSVSVNGGEARRMTVYDVMGDSYTDRLVGVLDEVVHPGWPDRVLDYRRGRITLGELGKRIIEGSSRSGSLTCPGTAARASGHSCDRVWPLAGGSSSSITDATRR